jgi:hypothetical protein
MSESMVSGKTLQPGDRLFHVANQKDCDRGWVEFLGDRQPGFVQVRHANGAVPTVRILDLQWDEMTEDQELQEFYAELANGGTLAKRALAHIRALSVEIKQLPSGVDTSVADGQGEQVWLFTGDDGELSVTDRWDVAKHLPFETTRYTRGQPDLTALQEENRILREGMKGDYDLDAWLEWAATSEALRKDLAESKQDYRELSVENDNLLDRACAFEQRNSDLVGLLRELYKFPLEHACATGSWPAQELCERIDTALEANKTEEGEADKKYVFETDAYGVALSPLQWSAVHAVFANYNESDNKDEEFKTTESSLNGLVSEILVELDLARGE